MRRAPPQPLSLRWHQEKYAQPGEFTLEDTRRRVALALAQVEPWAARAAWARRFERALNRGLLPGGRIMAGAGVDSLEAAGVQHTLMNCFVLPAQPQQELAHRLRRTLEAGGGVGIDLSAVPTGVLRELDRCETLAHAMESNPARGGRRAAQMAVLSVHHPEIAAFIHASPHAHPHLVRAVALDDVFMRAVEEAQPAALQRQQDLALAMWAGGEPSVLFTTRLQADDNLGDEEHLTATNPCGEQPLPPFGACALASIDLTRLVQRPFEHDAHVAWGVLAALVHVGVRLLDNTLEITRWPLMEQAREMQRHRRIGLGMTGLGDALAMLNLRYESPQACQQAAQLMRFIAHTAYRASVRLARERGAYPTFQASSVLRPPRFAARLPADLRHGISQHGLRHSHLLAIAPAASISMAFADGASTGIEPMVAPQWERSWRDPQGRPCTAVVQPLAWRLWGELKGVGRLAPEGWAWLDDITPEAQLRMVAALVPHVDGGISKTVSMPESTTPREIEALILMAWRLGLKGAAFFRRGSRAGVIATGTGPADAANRGPSPSCPAPGTPARGCP